MSVTVRNLTLYGRAFKKVTVLNNNIISGCSEFKKAVNPLIDVARYSFIIDLSSLLGTNVVSVLEEMRKRIEKYGGKIYIVAENPDVRDLLALVQIDRVIPVLSKQRDIKSYLK